MQIEDTATNESREALKREIQDEEYRYAYAEDFLNTWVATQIVALREQRKLSQTEFGKLIGTKQPGVSRLEDVNHSTWKTDTLKRIARALGVRLKISFETFGTLLDEDANFSRRFLMRPEFKNDLAFVERKPCERDQTASRVPALIATGSTGTVLPYDVTRYHSGSTVTTMIRALPMGVSEAEETAAALDLIQIPHESAIQFEKHERTYA
jgi:transcriptional regulator with XRE-family HTH domain